jgi:O-antigen/teichoic acid export membrane protein
VLIQFLWIKIDTSSIKLVIRTARQLLSYGGRVFFAKVGWESYRWADLILVGVLLSATHVGVYAVAWMIANGITRVTTYMFEVIFPEVSRRNTPETARDISFAVTQGIRMSAYIIFPVGAFLILISPHLILTFYGPAFHEAILPLQILTLMMFSHIFAIASPLFMGLAKPGLLSRISFISAGLNILLNLIMIPTFGIVGAALASAITRWGQWSCSLFILRGFVDFPVPWGFLLKALTSTGIASIVAGILLSSYEPMGSIDTFIVLLLVGAVFAVVYAVGLVVFRSITAYDLRLLDALTDSRLGFLSRLIRYSERYR